MNGDGYADIAIAAINTSPFGRINAGTAYVIYGHSKNTPFYDIDVTTSITDAGIGFQVIFEYLLTIASIFTFIYLTFTL